MQTKLMRFVLIFLCFKRSVLLRFFGYYNRMLKDNSYKIVGKRKSTIPRKWSIFYEFILIGVVKYIMFIMSFLIFFLDLRHI